MSFSVRSHTTDDVAVLEMHGHLTESDAIRNVVREALDSGTSQFIFNLEKVDYIDSSGLGALIESHQAIVGRQGSVRLTDLQKNPLSLLVITKLVTIFIICGNEQEALASLRSRAASS